MSFMDKQFARAHIKKSRLHLKNRSEVNRINFIKQRNYCVSLLRKTEKQYYANLNEKEVADNIAKRRFKNWKTIQTLLSDTLK